MKSGVEPNTATAPLLLNFFSLIDKILLVKVIENN